MTKTEKRDIVKLIFEFVQGGGVLYDDDDGDAQLLDYLEENGIDVDKTYDFIDDIAQEINERGFKAQAAFLNKLIKATHSSDKDGEKKVGFKPGDGALITGGIFKGLSVVIKSGLKRVYYIDNSDKQRAGVGYDYIVPGTRHRGQVLEKFVKKLRV